MAEPLRKLVPADREEAPETARAPQIAPVAPAEQRSLKAPGAAAKVRRFRRRDRVRWVLFALLPLALVVAGYFYVTGGKVMSTDDAYVQADRVGISTDVSGIVKEVAVTDNQRVEAGQCCIGSIPASSRSRSTTPKPIWRKRRCRSRR